MVEPISRAAAALVDWAAHELRAASDSPRLDAECLLSACTGLGRAQILAHPERELGVADAARFSASVARRRTGVPVAYIVGRREFYSLELNVAPEVLVPRPETEWLVETALELAPRGRASAGIAVLDLGTGSGAIALAIKQARPDFAVTAVDSSAAALAVARSNAERLGLSVRLVESSWFDSLRGETFDLIVANPPYVQSGDSGFEGPLGHEPRAALDGGVDGLDAYRAILAAVPGHLRAGGRLLFEHGAEQRAALSALAETAGFDVVAERDDLAGLPRVLVLARSDGAER